jgi:5-methylthioadenosine/S-adenosylhomocysteine deaminase
MLANCVTIKKKYDSIHLTHCMENDWRKDLIFSKYGKSSVELYNERDLLDNKTILFHGVHLNEKDIDILSKTGATVVHCPVSNFWTAAGIAPVSSMLEKGVNVCIGTDYASVDIWETMKVAYFLLKNNAPIQRFMAEDVFKMATQNGAAAYHQDSHGSIQNGFAADLVFIKKDSFTPDIHTGDFSTVVHNLLMETSKERIYHVMVDGDWIMFDRKLQTVNEEEINKGYQQMIEKVYSGINH